jgi:hypothetical protein
MLGAGCYIPSMSNASNIVSNPLANLTDEKLAQMSESCRIALFNLDYCSSGGGLYRDNAYFRKNWTACGSAACRAIHATWSPILDEIARRKQEREDAVNDAWERLQLEGKQGLGRGA